MIYRNHIIQVCIYNICINTTLLIDSKINNVKLTSKISYIDLDNRIFVAFIYNYTYQINYKTLL